MNTYEAMIIFREDMNDEALDEALDVFKEEVKQQGGEVVQAVRMGKRTFARKMDKQSAGHYVVVNMQLPGDRVRPLEDRLQLNDLFFRVQVVRASAQPAAAVAAQSANEA